MLRLLLLGLPPANLRSRDLLQCFLYRIFVAMNLLCLVFVLVPNICFMPWMMPMSYMLRLPLPMGVMKIYASRAPFVVMLSVDCLMNR